MDHTQPLNAHRGRPTGDLDQRNRAGARGNRTSLHGVVPWTPAASDGLRQHDPGPLSIAWRDRWLLLLVTMLVGSIAYGLSTLMAEVYVAETTLAFPYTSTEVALPGGDAERSRTLRTEAQRLTSYGLLRQAAKSMDDAPNFAVLGDPVADEDVDAIPSADADIITVRATASSADRAPTIADAVAAAYRRQVDWRQQTSIRDLEKRAKTLNGRINQQQRQLATQLEDAAKEAEDIEAAAGANAVVAAAGTALDASVTQLSEIQRDIDSLKAERSTATSGVQVLQPAATPGGPEQPRPLRNAATAILLALMAATTIRWWRSDPEPPVLEDAQAAEAMLGVPVVAEIPYLRRPAGPACIVTSKYPEVLDAYRMIAAATPVRGSVLVTAANRNESCSDLVLNMGAVLSRDGYRMLLIDGHPKAGHLPDRNAKHGAGLTDVLAGVAGLRDVMLSARVGEQARMGLVPWGTGPGGLPRSVGPELGRTIHESAVLADVVLVDGPPIASSADGLTLAGHVDGILLVVSTGTLASDVQRLRVRLDQLDRPLLGVVLQHTSSRRRSRRRRRTATRPVRWEQPVDLVDTADASDA